jgi:hypothetical protein
MHESEYDDMARQIASDFETEIIKLNHDIDKLQHDKNKLIETLKYIRHNKVTWKRNGIGGQDKYAGLPPLCRLIDAVLSEVNDG